MIYLSPVEVNEADQTFSDRILPGADHATYTVHFQLL